MRLLNDYKCQCGFEIEILCDPTIQQICPMCNGNMDKIIPAIVVGHPMKGKWHQSKKPVKQVKKQDKQYRDLGEMVME